MSTKTITLKQLAETVLQTSAALQETLEKRNLPQPSFDLDGLQSYPFDPEIQTIKAKLGDALEDLNQLVHLPQERFGPQILSEIHDLTALKVYNQYNFWDAVPLESPVSKKELAQKVGLPEELVSRLIRHSATSRVFDLTDDGTQVKHTVRSAAFVHDRRLRAWVGHHVDESWLGGANYADALRYYNADMVEPDKTGASYTFWRDEPRVKTLFDFFNKPEQKWRVARFGTAMEWATASPAFDMNHLHRMYDWKSLGAFTFVDIGGSVGHISHRMAASYPSGKFIVQDLPELSSSFDAVRPAEVKDRVSFEGHDFFNPQPVQGADIYFLKHILHDWSDPYAAKIIKQIVPAMINPRARLMFMEGVIAPRDAVPREHFRKLTGLDMQMLTMCNSKERTAEQWSQLLKLAHPDLHMIDIHHPAGSAFVLIEAALKAP